MKPIQDTSGQSLLTASQASAKIGCTPQHISKLRTQCGQFKGARLLGAIWLYLASEVADYKRNPLKKTGRPKNVPSRKSNGGKRLAKTA